MPPGYAEARNRVFQKRRYEAHAFCADSYNSAFMKAIRMHTYGGPEVLRYEDAPRPTVKTGQVLIRIHAAGVSPLDWRVRSGSLKEFIPHKLPLIPGWELSGVVEQLGPGTVRFKRGDEVFGIADVSRNGAYADYIAVPEASVALKPESLYHIYAAATPLSALTAWQSLFDLGQLNPGQRVLIHGSRGGMGHFAVQLAKWKGAYVIATASILNQELLRKLGADETIDYVNQQFEDVSGKVDLVLDTVGGETQERSWSLLKKNGALISAAQPPSKRKVGQFQARGLMCSVRPNRIQLSEIAKLIDSGKIRPIIDRVLPLREAKRAHELSEQHHARGKIVLRVKDI
jgi:NADPH:quinone reductase-like Zn-dependent oxidoreductase